MKKRFFLIFWFTVFGMGLFSIAYGVSSYKTQFNNFYAAKGIVTAGSAIDQCLLCHTTNTGPNASNLNPYGNAYASSYNFGTIESQDSDGDGFNNLAEITAKTFPGDPNSKPTGGADTTKPTVSAFTIPATSTTLAVSITSFTATDNIGVTGYMATESATAPLASAAGWSAARPASYTCASAGAKTLYAWAKDAAGNVSLSRTASVTITVSTPPPNPGTSPDMTNWVGKWFKVVEKDTGYYARNSTLAIDRSSVVAYLKIWDWDSSQKIFHVDRYEYDTARSQWFSEPMDLNYISGSQQAFLCRYQVTDNATQNMMGFTVLIRQGGVPQVGVPGVLGFPQAGARRGSLRTLGGYYIASGEDTAGSSVNYVGGLSIRGTEVPISKVPVPSSIVLR